MLLLCCCPTACLDRPISHPRKKTAQLPPGDAHGPGGPPRGLVAAGTPPPPRPVINFTTNFLVRRALLPTYMHHLSRRRAPPPALECPGERSAAAQVGVDVAADCPVCPRPSTALPELELELIQPHMAQKPVLRGEVGLYPQVHSQSLSLSYTHTQTLTHTRVRARTSRLLFEPIPLLPRPGLGQAYLNLSPPPKKNRLKSTLPTRRVGTRNAHPASPRSTGFCAIWACISSSFEFGVAVLNKSLLSGSPRASGCAAGLSAV